MSVGGQVDGSSSIWVGASRGSCSGCGGGGGCGVAGVCMGGGANGQPFSHLNPVYTKPGSGPDISRNKQCIKNMNRCIDLSLGYNFRVFRVKKLPLNLSHSNVPSLYYLCLL